MWEWQWRSYWLPAYIPWDVNLSREIRQLWSLVIFPTPWGFAQTWLLLDLPLQAPFADCPYQAPSSHPLWVPGAPGSLVCPLPSMLISVLYGFATVFAASFVFILYLQPDGKLLPELRRNKCYRPINTLLQKRLILHPTPLLPCVFQNHLPHTLVCIRYCVRG